MGIVFLPMKLYSTNEIFCEKGCRSGKNEQFTNNMDCSKNLKKNNLYLKILIFNLKSFERT